MMGAVTGDVEIGGIGVLLWQLIRTESSPDLTSSSPMPVSLTSSISFLMRRVSMVSLLWSLVDIWSCWIDRSKTGRIVCCLRQASFLPFNKGMVISIPIKVMQDCAALSFQCLL